jgi:hypothetical protein
MANPYTDFRVDRVAAGARWKRDADVAGFDRFNEMFAHRKILQLS